MTFPRMSSSPAPWWSWGEASCALGWRAPWGASCGTWSMRVPSSSCSARCASSRPRPSSPVGWGTCAASWPMGSSMRSPWWCPPTCSWSARTWAWRGTCGPSPSATWWVVLSPSWGRPSTGSWPHSGSIGRCCAGCSSTACRSCPICCRGGWSVSPDGTWSCGAAESWPRGSSRRRARCLRWSTSWPPSSSRPGSTPPPARSTHPTAAPSSAPFCGATRWPLCRPPGWSSP